jgi:hypothetical protein
METLLMGRRCCYVLFLIFIYYSQQSSCATIEVGGPVGWTNFDTSTNKAPNYATWVSSQSVIVGDILGDNYNSIGLCLWSELRFSCIN